MAINCNASSLPQVVNCFQSCIPEGMQLAVQNYLWCQIANTSKFGGGGGTPVTPIGTITNFQFAPSGSGLLVQGAWDTPPANATATELWTSTDNITFTLASTTPTPGAGATVPAPAVGSFMWAKARWVSATQQGAFSAVIEVSGRVCDWAARVIAHGGATTTLATRVAMNTLDLQLVAGSLDSVLVALIPLVPDSVIAAITPLYKAKGFDPWSNQGPFVAGDLTVNGLKGDGVGKYLNSVIMMSTDLTVNSNTLFLYESVVQSNVGELSGAGGANITALMPNDSNNGAATNYYSQGQLVSTAPILPGFYLGSRVSNTDQRLYFANSSNAWAQVGATQAAAGTGALPALTLLFMAFNNGGATNFSNGTLSIAGAAAGMTSAQGKTLFNACDAFRIALGGGRV